MLDISPDFILDKTDFRIIHKILPHEGTPEAIKLFDRYAYQLTDYCYWFLLSTLWVSYTSDTDLDLWKKLFSSTRPKRETSMMKPSELIAFRRLPDEFNIYRAHKAGETDWIAYTLQEKVAVGFALRNMVDDLKVYRVKKTDALCLFLRRDEAEILVLDKTKAEFIGKFR